MNPEKWVFSFFVLLLFRYCISIDKITPTRPVRDAEVIVSGGESFVLGFFSPGKSSLRFVGIWYNKVSEQTVVWVANRDRPINGTVGVLSIGEDGDLTIYGSDQSTPIWQTNVSAASTRNGSTARLLDSGNLVLFRGNDERERAWQSFNHPTNTLLPGMKYGLDRRTGLDRFVTSWKSRDDPGTGEYCLRVDTIGSPQSALYRGSTLIWRSLPWVGYLWSGEIETGTQVIFNTTLTDDGNEVTSAYSLVNPSIVSALFLDESGYLQMLTWVKSSQTWVRFYEVPDDKCEYYSHCGPNGFCDPNNGHDFECTCLPGYEPHSAAQWYVRDVSSGCVKKRIWLSMCHKGEGFVKMSMTKIPDTSTAQIGSNMSPKDCEKECLRNCSCTAYTAVHGGKCLMWYGNLIDVRKYSTRGIDLYVRVDRVELAQWTPKKSQSSHGKKVVIAVSSVVAIILLILSALFWFVTKRIRGLNSKDNKEENLELPIFDMNSISYATNKFCHTHIIGEGGFGPVYKGQLSNGKELAVKRLSTNSAQGLNEFKNEVILIAKLQHRNLVKLLGCCIHKEERMLIYEYMPNGSLNYFIFGVENLRKRLTWRCRLDIIVGIAKGVLYLHQDSRLRVIHRDLKASNVLLDSEMNPKIADFGTARAFGGNQSSAKTKTVIGTYGYMSPEYVFDGLFSVKSDVFSFGVIILEIISGKRNRMIHHPDHDLTLLGHAWTLWNEGNISKLLDPLVGDPIPMAELIRFALVALLCVQKCPEDRPIMSSVLLMLITETATLPQPKKPGFYAEWKPNVSDNLANKSACSTNEVSMTLLEPR